MKLKKLRRHVDRMFIVLYVLIVAAVFLVFWMTHFEKLALL